MPKTYAQRLLAPSGRWAIMTRLDEYSPWVQVESVLGNDAAAKMVEDLQADAEKRLDYIEDCKDEVGSWGDDAPTEDPNSTTGA